MKNKYIFLVLFLEMVSCSSPLEYQVPENNILYYQGDNPFAKELVYIFSNNREELKNLENLLGTDNELLYDATTLSRNEYYNLHYSVPIVSKESKRVNGCVIYEYIEEQGIIFREFLNQDRLEQIPENDRYLFSYKFAKWYLQGYVLILHWQHCLSFAKLFTKILFFISFSI